MLNLCTHQRWRITKADAKSAFLQGAAHQGSRNVFTIPVPELALALRKEKLFDSSKAPMDWPQLPEVGS